MQSILFLWNSPLRGNMSFHGWENIAVKFLPICSSTGSSGLLQSAIPSITDCFRCLSLKKRTPLSHSGFKPHITSEKTLRTLLQLFLRYVEISVGIYRISNAYLNMTLKLFVSDAFVCFSKNLTWWLVVTIYLAFVRVSICHVIIMAQLRFANILLGLPSPSNSWTAALHRRWIDDNWQLPWLFFKEGRQFGWAWNHGVFLCVFP